MNSENIPEQSLDAYVQGKMSREMLIAALQKDNIANPDQEADLHHAAVAALQRSEVYKQVSSIHQLYISNKQSAEVVHLNPDTKTNSIRKTTYWLLRIAAVVLLVLGSKFMYDYNNTSTEKLYSEIYQSYSLNTNRASFTEVIPHRMVENFKAGDYAGVIKSYEKLGSANVREKFLTAISYHETAAYEKAIILFKEILSVNLNSTNRLYNDEAEFYLGLSYLKINNPKEARILFEKIKNELAHTYHDVVTSSMLRKLKWLE